MPRPGARRKPKFLASARTGLSALKIAADLFDKLNLDIFWLKDESLEDSANLPDPDIIAAEIVEDLEAALSQFAAIAADLKK